MAESATSSAKASDSSASAASSPDAPTGPRALILSGAGRYADPWHPFAETSLCVAGILREEGFSVEISEDVDTRIRDLSGIDLLILNVGNPLEPDAADSETAAALTGWVEMGGPLLVLHVACTSFRFVPDWEAILGAVWVRGTSMHPPYGRARIRIYPERHAIVSGLRDFELSDERYSFLRVAPDVVPLAGHQFDGVEHPLLWARGYEDARVVYNALGHDVASYDSTEHRNIVARSARWLIEGDSTR